MVKHFDYNSPDSLSQESEIQRDVEIMIEKISSTRNPCMGYGVQESTNETYRSMMSYGLYYALCARSNDWANDACSDPSPIGSFYGVQDDHELKQYMGAHGALVYTDDTMDNYKIVMNGLYASISNRVLINVRQCDVLPPVPRIDNVWNYVPCTPKSNTLLSHVYDVANAKNYVVDIGCLL
ncbi:unnamed protein product [Haemonchus placei]|uniref:SCP domain-containing protein n=1 Tax=Haemonchus placei TaxID=6290 RepID=A0A0N4WM23_HAEPC|nr:unnamed protein product [Haemonchus placei]